MRMQTHEDANACHARWCCHLATAAGQVRPRKLRQLQVAARSKQEGVARGVQGRADSCMCAGPTRGPRKEGEGRVVGRVCAGRMSRSTGGRGKGESSQLVGPAACVLAQQVGQTLSDGPVAEAAASDRHCTPSQQSKRAARLLSESLALAGSGSGDGQTHRDEGDARQTPLVRRVRRSKADQPPPPLGRSAQRSEAKALAGRFRRSEAEKPLAGAAERRWALEAIQPGCWDDIRYKAGILSDTRLGYYQIQGWGNIRYKAGVISDTHNSGGCLTCAKYDERMPLSTHRLTCHALVGDVKHIAWSLSHCRAQHGTPDLCPLPATLHSDSESASLLCPHKNTKAGPAPATARHMFCRGTAAGVANTLRASLAACACDAQPWRHSSALSRRQPREPAPSRSAAGAKHMSQQRRLPPRVWAAASRGVWVSVFHIPGCCQPWGVGQQAPTPQAAVNCGVWVGILHTPSCHQHAVWVTILHTASCFQPWGEGRRLSHPPAAVNRGVWVGILHTPSCHQHVVWVSILHTASCVQPWGVDQRLSQPQLLSTVGYVSASFTPPAAANRGYCSWLENCRGGVLPLG
eukprot:365008-Chlamydomonas_euryale.AAC.6